MTKFIIAALALAAASSFAQAERNYDLRDSDTYTGTYADNTTVGAVARDAQTFAIEEDGWIVGRYGLTKDALEARRWDEKNN